VVRWLSNDEQRAWRRLAAVVTLLPAVLDSQLQRDVDLTHYEYWVLAMLSEAPDRALRMSELAALSNGSLSRLSHVVSRLDRRGYVRRDRTPEDGRGWVATLTDSGHAKIVASAPGHVEEVRRRVFDTLTKAQVAQLDELCSAILKRLTT
jgi:DNA-binding MarR family transcriptional regulator